MKKLIIATVMLTVAAGAASAQSVREARGQALEAVGEVNAATVALNGQINLGPVTSTLAIAVEDAADVSATAAGIGNSLSASVDTDRFGALGLEAGQANTGAITASLNGTLEDVGGEVSGTAAAIGNSASLSVDSANGAIGAALIQANRGAVTANADVALSEIAKASSITAAAIGNSISIVNGVAE